MNITYEDDKKDKYQSVRATATFGVSTNMGYANIYIEGLGRNEAEAKDELVHVVNQIKEWLVVQ